MSDPIEWDPQVYPVDGTVNFTSPSTPSDTSVDAEGTGADANAAAIAAEVVRATDAEATKADLAGATFTGVVFPQAHATSGAPAYAKGGLYFDTTSNKLMVGGATAWETVTSA